MKIHELKLDIKYFDAVKNGNKNFELRKNDRDYQVGDILELKAWTEDTEKYHTHGKGSYLSWDTLEQSKPLLDFGQEIDEKLSDYFMVPNAEEADTIKVRVRSIITAEKYNEKCDFTDPAILEEQLDDKFGVRGTQKVLKECFETNRLPGGYVLLKIEGIE